MSEPHSSFLSLPRVIRNIIYNIHSAKAQHQANPFYLQRPFHRVFNFAHNFEAVHQRLSTDASGGASSEKFMSHALAYTCKQIFFEYLDEHLLTGNVVHHLKIDRPMKEFGMPDPRADSLLSRFADQRLPCLFAAKCLAITFDISQAIPLSSFHGTKVSSYHSLQLHSPNPVQRLNSFSQIKPR